MTTNNHDNIQVTLDELPFYQVTPIELYEILETPENKIKCCLENNNFQSYLYQTLPEQLNSDNYSTCKYYTEDKVNNAAKNGIPDILILHHNIRSMNKNFGELMGLLLNIDIDFDIIALTEIGQVNCENVANLLRELINLREINPLRILEELVSVENHLIMNERFDLKLETDNDNIKVENAWFKITNPITHDKFIVAVIYRHPIYTKAAYNVFSKELEKSFDIMSKEIIKCIICCDINVNGLKIETDINVNSFFNMTLSNNFIPHIPLPTHITSHSISLIDHILVKESDKLCNKYI